MGVSGALHAIRHSKLRHKFHITKNRSQKHFASAQSRSSNAKEKKWGRCHGVSYFFLYFCIMCSNVISKYMKFHFDRTKHVFHSPEFEEVIKDTIRFFNGTPVQPIPPMERFEGAGIYALYYIGKQGIYKNFQEINRLACNQPIYVGKAVPRGWR